MLAAFKSLIAGLSEEAPARESDRAAHDRRLAAAALLFHVADLGGSIHQEEREKLRSLVSERFDLDGAHAARLLAEAKEVDHEAVDLFHFTNVLNRSLDHEGRLEVVEMMWEVALADGKLDELEETTLWRAAELLGVSTRERVALRQKVAARRGPAADGGFVREST
jgi:uncharacterized tellurite resistance protein B-like protein